MARLEPAVPGAVGTQSWQLTQDAATSGMCWTMAKGDCCGRAGQGSNGRAQGMRNRPTMGPWSGGSLVQLGSATVRLGAVTL